MQSDAVIFTAPNKVEFGKVECPDPVPGDVVVRVTHSWISNGTEGSFLRGERIAGDTPFRPGDPMPFPIIAGYQKIGVIEWIGSEVRDLRIGETVFCAMGKVKGMFADYGGQVSPSVSPRHQIWKLPAGRDPLAFSGLVLTQVGYNCGARAPIEAAEGALVIGDGMVGHWAAQTLSLRGVDVVMVGRHDDRLSKFRTSSFRHIINEKQCDWVQRTRELLPKGVRVAVDTVGSIAAIQKILPLMNKYGHIVSAGFYGTNDALPLQPLRGWELSVDLVSGWSQDRMDKTLELIAGGYLETLPLITHHFPVSRAAEAWALIASKSENALGVILDWN
ncbi:MAG TPA: zinc-binding dehydrogenase [Candidatus Brocadiia bacterium]|nr:zinc-binding dehydrogenase [Candidatus Brocadiia bacterium]